MDQMLTRAEWMGSATMITAPTIELSAILWLRPAHSGERMLCHLEPKAANWHYRTRIPPLEEERCWYDGPRMKSRSELYWAEAPARPMQIDGGFEGRWKWADPSGWT